MKIFIVLCFLTCVFCLSSFASTDPFEVIDVTIESDAPTPTGKCLLGATLTVPVKNLKALAVLVHGSGPINRDGAIPGGFSPYKDVAEHLSSNGIAAVRFDKRSYIKSCVSKMNHPKFTHNVFVNDIKSVIHFAQNQPQLKHLPTLLIGHSQGVNFASQIATEKTLRIDGLVLLAGLGKYAIDKTLLRQINDQLQNQELTEDVRQQYEKILNEGQVFFQKIRNGSYNEQDKFMGGYALFWDQYIAFTEKAGLIAEQAKVPALVLQGNDDTNVTREDFDTLVSATSNNKDSSYSWVPRCNHLLTISPSTKVADEVLYSISNWILKTF